MSLNRKEAIIIFCAFGAVILAAMIQILIREWYQVDLRFEECDYYFTKDSAITSLRLKNYGKVNAENIVISASFPDKIIDISSSEPSLPFHVIERGVNNINTTGKIDYIVPDQTVFIYFAIENTNEYDISQSDTFVKDITYKGGRAKTGEPIFYIILFTLLPGIFAGILVNYLANRSMKKVVEESKNKIEEDRSILIDQSKKVEDHLKKIELLKSILNKTCIFFNIIERDGIEIPEEANDIKCEIKDIFIEYTDE